MKNQILNKLESLQQEKEHTKFWNITWEQGIFLSSLIELKQPKHILEIGTSNGFSALFLALNLKEESTIDTIEVNEERFSIAKQNFKEAGINPKQITQHLGEAFEVLPKLKTKYDFIFIDAAHQFYKELLVELEEQKLLNEDYTIVFDNISTHKHLETFKEYTKTRYDSSHIDIGGGFLILKSLLR
jgi:predicted O-methyltransferase YrrM